MSSRQDYRRRDRSAERIDRDRDRDRHRYRDRGAPRRSRSRSPPRRGERDRRGADRRDYGRDREDDRRERDRRDDRRDDRRRDGREKRDEEREGRREPLARRDGEWERERDRAVERDKDSGVKPPERPYERDGKPSAEQRAAGEPERTQSESVPPPAEQPVQRGASEVPPDGYEEGEEMDITNDGDADMMAMMGMSGFGSTKGRHVEGNQEGSVDVKKIRTWRQYMNRRGGFNRPLDKIK